jgi:hypothetical protein
MSDYIVQLTLEQFTQLLDGATLRRTIDAVHLHHTWRPRRRDFRGRATIEAIGRYHREQLGWRAIAQHLTIDPAGGIWTGRNWNLPPASQKGANGDGSKGPFMIEMIGDFDLGQDPFDGSQRETVVAVVARLLRRFGLKGKALRFHRQLGSPKSCPGTGIDFDELLAEVEADSKKLATSRGSRSRAAGAVTRISPSQLHGAGVIDVPRAALEAPGDEVPERTDAGRWIDQAGGEAIAAQQRDWRRRRSLDLRPRAEDRWAGLRPYVVNLALGQLSEGGEFQTRPSDVDGILDGLQEYTREVERPRLMLHAHGGLVSETSALEYAAKVAPWWRSHDVYPVFFVWESGLLEILGQFVLGRRDLADWTSDLALEAVLRLPGTLAWSGMKKSARLASSADAGNAAPGGARLFADLLAARRQGGELTALEVHAVGHSAGSIFHAHLLPILSDRGIPIASLQLLAPALTVSLYRERLAQLIASRRVQRLHLFTMEDRAERSDDCMTVYRKSLLYLVSRAFEPPGGRALVGLHRSIRGEKDLAKLFGLGGGNGGTRAELQLSWMDDDREANPLTQALRHGDFDNDPATMSSVLRRILSVPDEIQLGRHDFPWPSHHRSLLDLRPPVPAASAVTGETRVGSETASGANGQYRALCVGINRYPAAPLTGCVRDAQTWGRELEGLGFRVTYLLDEEATRRNMIDALEGMLNQARPGDRLVFQYSGHGTQVPDDNGDEADQFDEAFVPFDYASGRLLLDDDLAEIVARVPEGVQLTLFMDCCHSGTNSRFAPFFGARTSTDERVRWLPPTPELVRAHQQFRATLPSPPSSIKEQSAARVAHLAACQDQEYAWESRGQGDFTVAGSGLLAAAVARGDTNEDFLAAVRTEVARRGRQHPMMMRPSADMARRPLLGGPMAVGRSLVDAV